MLQLGCLLSCNSSDKDYKNYMSRVAIEVLEKLQLKHLRSCNCSAFWFAIEVLLSSCNCGACWVAVVASEITILVANWGPVLVEKTQQWRIRRHCRSCQPKRTVAARWPPTRRGGGVLKRGHLACGLHRVTRSWMGMRPVGGGIDRPARHYPRGTRLVSTSLFSWL
jgi:hypothetical protein